MKLLTFLLLYYSKRVNHPAKSICEEKCSLLDFLVEALTRSLLPIFYKDVEVKTDVYHQKAKFAAFSLLYILPPYYSDLK